MKNKIPEFDEIFSMENLMRSWKEFQRGKKYKKDVADFSMNLFHNLSLLRKEIISGEYKHGGYFHFKINDPKPRDIHKASVKDRIVHHAIYGALYAYFDQKFISDSYSCRTGKGTLKAILRFEKMARSESENCTETIFVLKCDIRKCFASVDHNILKSILSENIKDKKILSIIETIIESFPQGLPLGNLTSQLFINVYLNELDLYVKHKIKAKKYIRYADDFVIFSKNKKELESYLFLIEDFLKRKLKFEMHPDKVFIKTVFSGVGFLGWTHFPKYRVLRTKTKKRMFRNMKNNPSNLVVSSYLGLLNHGNAHDLQKEVKNMVECRE